MEISQLDFDVSSHGFTTGDKIIKRNGEQRKPTRKPDPKVYNRNAVNARENRRKKKLYLETLERQLLEARMTNEKLGKALKRQIAISRQLEQQKKYYQNIIANQTEISSLLSILSNKDAHIPSEATNSFVSDSKDNNDNDFDECGCFESCSSLNNIWGETPHSGDETQKGQERSARSIDLSWDDDIGAVSSYGNCLHKTLGKDWLEDYCPTCQLSTSPSPPLQLFSEESIS
ncbi:uncharacterized protein LOC142220291 isoform X2 [Haematobia irritans]|uniref:uncharacterized protein LOC142220291 isoform X2 n=1 Tax=Haematobia irritans TaxID=7368 RepID=UPI003F502570